MSIRAVLFQTLKPHEFNFKIYPVVTEFDPPPPTASRKEKLQYYPGDEKHRRLSKISFKIFGRFERLTTIQAARTLLALGLPHRHQLAVLNTSTVAKHP